MTLATKRTQSDVEERFRALTADWKQKSRRLSNTAQMSILPSYQRIIGLGQDAIPLILAELRREPDHWFWALESITEENPVPSAIAGDVSAAAQAWLEWGEAHGYVAK